MTAAPSSSLHDLQKRVTQFIGERDWTQFHEDPRNTLLALGSELGELMEIYRFTTLEEAKNRSSHQREDVMDEAADIFYLLLMFCAQNEIDLEEAFDAKEKKRAVRYPVEKFKGVNKKYNAA
jgi:NTP pyrophosphatase (non-canonical NTP hydrolase)